MNKARSGLLALIMGVTVALTACSSDSSNTASSKDSASSDKPEVLKVAAVQPPMTDVVTAAGEAIDDKYKIELVEVADYITSNTLLRDGEVYANYSEHIPYMEEFNEKNNADLVGVQPVYNFEIAFYSKDLDDIADLPEGAQIAIPDDTSNTGRALKLLAANDVIKLDPKIDPYNATPDDVIDNPKNVEFLQIPIASLNAAYEESDLVFQWPSHIAALGLTPEKDGLITELDPVFALNVVVRGENADSEATEALKKAFTSDEVRKVIEGNGTIEVAW